ncbi:outer membrane protein assembly factor BamA [bacterium]|nr:outer membrane protein assembly factor BamA [candidate division CSSED10-310 bacterium]
MENRLIQRILTYLILTIVGVLMTDIAVYGQDHYIVGDLEVVGNRQIETETILYIILSKSGQPLDLNQVQRDIKALYRTGFFDDITVTYTVTGNQVNLVYTVKERPIISEILITGMEVIGLTTLQDELTIKTGERYDPVKVRESINKIQAKYLERGYNYAFITPRLTETQTDTASLLFAIDEGTKVYIEEIEFIGNERFIDGTRFWGLRSKMKENREKWWMSFLTSSGKFQPDLIQDDLKAIEEYYKSNGYLNVSLGEPKVRITPPVKKRWRKPKRYVTIEIPVIEGQVYRFGSIDAEVADESIYPKSVVLKMMRSTRLEKYQKYFGGSAFFKAGPRLETGRIYSYAIEQEAMSQLGDLYGSAGYIYAMIDSVKKVDEENRIVDVTFRIIEGEQAFLHRLEFKGNDRTRDRVLRRNFRLEEGDVFNTAKIKQSISRIQYLGYIDEVVPEIKPLSDPTEVDIVVSLNDSKQTEIQVAGGYSGYEGLYGTLGLSEHNLFGRGQEFNFSLTSGKRRKTFSVSFIDEWILDRPYLGSVSIWDTERDYDYSKRRSRGGSLMGGRALKFNLSSRLGYKWEINTVYDVDEDASEDVIDVEGDQVTSSLTGILIHETLDNRRDPTRGTKTQLTLEFAGGILGGDNHFYKSELAWSYFHPLPKNFVMALYGEITYANGLEGEELPFYERYFLGGPRTVRGYQEQSIGPWDEYGQNLGGNKSLRLSAELHIPIAAPLKAILFADAGDAYFKDDRYDIRSLRPSIGFEVRFYVPGFWIPLRFIWGYNLDPLEDEDRNDFQFTMGTFL